MLRGAHRRQGLDDVRPHLRSVFKMQARVNAGMKSCHLVRGAAPNTSPHHSLTLAVELMLNAAETPAEISSDTETDTDSDAGP